MNESIKKKTKSMHVNNNYHVHLKFLAISTELSEMISKRKEDYYHILSDKLNDPHTSSKSYWSILKTLYNRKKIPLIPPILIKNKLISMPSLHPNVTLCNKPC